MPPEASPRTTPLLRPTESAKSLDLAGWADVAKNVATVVIAALISIACGNSGGGDGGSGGTGGGPSGPASTSSRLELFQASLDGVDPRDPGNVVILDPAASELAEDSNRIGAIPVLSRDGTGGSVPGPLVEYVIYARDDGTLYRVSTDASAATPVPERVSSENEALPLCEALPGFDLAEVMNTRLAYASDGDNCTGLLTWSVVSLGNDETMDPQVFPGMPVSPLLESESLAHAGWLAVEDGVLIRLDPDLSVVADDLRRGVMHVEELGRTENGFIFLEIDQGLFSFDVATNDLMAFDFSFTGPCSCSLSFGADREFGFIVDDGALLRADPATGGLTVLDEPADASTNPFAAFFGNFGFVVVSDNYVAWSYFADTDGDVSTLEDQFQRIRSVARDGSSAQELNAIAAEALPFAGFIPFLPRVTNDWLFINGVTYNAATQDDFRARAVAQRLDGSQTVARENSFFIGGSFTPNAGIGLTGVITAITRLDGLPELQSFGSLVTTSLTTVNPQNPASGDISLGTLPVGTVYAASFPGLGPERLGAAFFDPGSGTPQTDILYWVDGQANSLTRVTNTGTVNEVPAGLF